MTHKEILSKAVWIDNFLRKHDSKSYHTSCRVLPYMTPVCLLLCNALAWFLTHNIDNATQHNITLLIQALVKVVS